MLRKNCSPIVRNMHGALHCATDGTFKIDKGGILVRCYQFWNIQSAFSYAQADKFIKGLRP